MDRVYAIGEIKWGGGLKFSMSAMVTAMKSGYPAHIRIVSGSLGHRSCKHQHNNVFAKRGLMAKYLNLRNIFAILAK